MSYSRDTYPTMRTPETLQDRWSSKRVAFLDDVKKRDFRFTLWTAQEQDITGSITFRTIPISSRIKASGGRWNFPWYVDDATGVATFLEGQPITLTGTPHESTPDYGKAPGDSAVRPYTDRLFHRGDLEVGIIDPASLRVTATHHLGTIAAMTLQGERSDELTVWSVAQTMPAIQTASVR